jgi:glycosyltransferase involved in cell wall biosynthesis
MQQSSILLLPTYIDCGPTALKEALSMGLWPICYDYSAPGAYIRQAGFGSLVRYADRQQLTHQLSKCIRQKPWLDAARRERCLRFTRSAFSPNHIWPRLLRNYQQILENSGYLPL